MIKKTANNKILGRVYIGKIVGINQQDYARHEDTEPIALVDWVLQHSP